MKLSKSKMIQIGSSLLILLILGLGLYLADKNGLIKPQASSLITSRITSSELPVGATANGKIVLSSGGDPTKFQVYLDYPSLLMLNTADFDQKYSDISTQVNTDGTFSLSNLPLSADMILTASNGYEFVQMEVKTPATAIAFNVDSFPVDGSANPGTVTINFKDVNGSPIKLANVTLSALNSEKYLTGKTDSSGKASFSNVPPDVYFITLDSSESGTSAVPTPPTSSPEQACWKTDKSGNLSSVACNKCTNSICLHLPVTSDCQGCNINKSYKPTDSCNKMCLGIITAQGISPSTTSTPALTPFIPSKSYDLGENGSLTLESGQNLVLDIGGLQ